MENFDWISYDKMMDKSLQTQVVHALSEAGLTLATAESCTGGLIAARITDVSGSSAVFHCGMVTYSNDMKIKMLGVRPETLRDFSAVSAETAKEMADGVRQFSGADIAVAVTGNAGPEPSEGKPVGEVYISLCCGWHQVTLRKELGRRMPAKEDLRQQIRFLVSDAALQLVLDAIRMREGKQMSMQFLIEVIGTIAFASSGAMVAIRKRLDLFGVLVLGATTAVGGGIIRDIILQITPPGSFQNPVYFVLAAVTVGIIFLICYLNPYFLDMRFLEGYERLMNILDAIGLGAFTVLGAQKAVAAGYENYRFLAIFLGVVTGVGGGLLRDMMAGITPYILKKHIYACASILGAMAYIYGRMLMPDSLALVVGAAVVIIVRMLATKYRWNLPVARMPKN